MEFHPPPTHTHTPANNFDDSPYTYDTPISMHICEEMRYRASIDYL